MLRWNKKQYFYNFKFASQKDFWKAIKFINKQDTTIPALWDGSTPITSNDAKAEVFNSYFYECFNHSIPLLSDPIPLDPEACPASILCTEEQVTDLLCTLDTTKSTGLDGVSALMLKLLYRSHPVSLNSSTYLLHLGHFLQSGNVQESC